MILYDYVCIHCNKKWQELSKIVNRNDFKLCTRCFSSTGKRIYEKFPKMVEGGENKDPRKWSDKFWDNAEDERIKREKKSNDEEFEKLKYNDKNTEQKIKNKITNTENNQSKEPANAIVKRIETLKKI
jgi:cytochrome c556